MPAFCARLPTILISARAPGTENGLDDDEGFFLFLKSFFLGSAFCLRRRRPRLFRLLLNTLKNGYLLLSFSILLWASRPRRRRH